MYRRNLGILGSLVMTYALTTGCSDNKPIVGRDGVKYIGANFMIQNIGSKAGIDQDVIRSITADGLGPALVEIPFGLNGHLDTDHDDGPFGRIHKEHVHIEDPRNVVVRNDLVNKRSYVIPQRDYGNTVVGEPGKTKGKGFNWDNLAKYDSYALAVLGIGVFAALGYGAIHSRKKHTTTHSRRRATTNSGSTGDPYSPYDPATTIPSLGRTMRRPTRK